MKQIGTRFLILKKLFANQNLPTFHPQQDHYMNKNGKTLKYTYNRMVGEDDRICKNDQNSLIREKAATILVIRSDTCMDFMLKRSKNEHDLWV